MKTLQKLFPFCFVSAITLLFVTGLINGTPPDSLEISFLLAIGIFLIGFGFLIISKSTSFDNANPTSVNEEIVKEFHNESSPKRSKSKNDISEKDWQEVYQQACKDLNIAQE